MKTTIVALAGLVALGCGPEPSGPLGVCYHSVECEAADADSPCYPVEGHTIFRPCEGDTSVTCTVHILDHEEIYSIESDEVMTEGECQ